MIVQKTSVFPAPRDVVFHGVIRYSFTQCPNAEFAKRHHMEDVLPVM